MGNGDYYFLIGTESGEVYYLSYHGEGWLSAGSDGYAIYGTGDYDTLDDLYNYGYEATDYMLSLLYLAAVYGYGSEDGYSWDYDWEIYITEWVDTSYGGYYDGDDFTVMSASNGGYLASGTYAESNLTGAEWTAAIDYASSDMEVTEELEEWATDLLL